jgi:glycosyltransferase involved in cell wall biosynthesis
MTVRPRISVVLPNYNHAAYVGQALAGLLKQTRPPDEVIVIDDASTDDSLRVIERATAGRPEVALIRRERNQGVIAALNEGVERATGDLIGLYAADDVLFPDFLAEQERLLTAHPEAAFGCTAAQLWDGDGHRIGGRPALLPTLTARYVAPAEFVRQLRWGDNFFLGVVSLFRRERLQAFGAFDPTLGPFTDGVVLRRLAAHHGYVFNPRELGAWRCHGHNYSRISSRDAARTRAMAERAAFVLVGDDPPRLPSTYAERFIDRAMFAAAKIPLLRGEEQSNEIVAITKTFLEEGRRGRYVSYVLDRTKPRNRLFLLTILFVCFRPYNALSLIIEPVRRGLSRVLARVIQPTGK